MILGLAEFLLGVMSGSNLVRLIGITMVLSSEKNNVTTSLQFGTI
jgi:hypothetical protein